MRGGFYVRLAATGISKNKKLYYPYILTCICMVMMYYIISFLCRSEEFKEVPGAATLQSILGFGVMVIAIFSLIFLYYTNSFLIRRRQKEFGLYNILGMGKRNLVKILLWENLLTALSSLSLGLACGVLLSKAVELVAARILGGMADFGFSVDLSVFLDTIVLFVGIFFLVMLRMLISILRSRPVEMLRSEEEGLRQRYPRDIVVNIYPEEGEDVEPLHDEINRIVEEHDVQMENAMQYTMLSVAALQSGDMLYFDSGEAYRTGEVNVIRDIRQMYIFPLLDYNRLMGEEKTLSDGEALLYTTKMEYEYDTISLENCGTWKVKEKVPDFVSVGGDVANVSSGVFLFVKDESVIRQIEQGEAEIYGDNMSSLEKCYAFDLDCSEEEQIRIAEEIGALTGTQSERERAYPLASVECREAERAGFYGLNGGLFFLGLLLGIVFLFGTVLIMYYKQISEGYEDQERFDILMKVGMTGREVRQSINSQVLTVFFLPLVVSGIHTAFAFPMISKMVVIMGVTDQKFLIAVTAGCFLIFALFYVLMYVVTSREYFKIVSKKR